MRPIAIYTYDAGGERILKHNNTSVSIFLNGKMVADTIQTDATIYPSGMLVAKLGNNGSEEEQTLAYTKHYYAGTQRVSSKIGTTENLGDYLQDWFTGGIGGPVDVVGTANQMIITAEQGVTQVYNELGIEAPEFNSNPVFYPVQSFTHGGQEIEHYFFHPDHLGSSSYITNFVGEVSQHMEYFAFGETFVEEHRSSNNSPYKFNAKELDEETGWYYYGARYYDPRTSVWLSVDPKTEQTMQPYQYCYQNPITLIDPNGMSPTPPEYYQIFPYRSFFVQQAGYGGSYLGNVNPNPGSYEELEIIRGAFYHKNTSNAYASIGNWGNSLLGGDDDFWVEKKPFDLGNEILADGVNIAGEMLVTGIVFKALGGLAGQLFKNAGNSLWKIASLERGFVYEKMLNLKGAFSSKNFPVIDAFYNGIATSIKTLDLSAKSYAKGNTVYNTLKGYIDKLYNFNGATWGKDVVRGSDVKSKILEVGIPRGATKAQVEQINKAIDYATDKGIKMNVRAVQ